MALWRPGLRTDESGPHDAIHRSHGVHRWKGRRRLDLLNCSGGAAAGDPAAALSCRKSEGDNVKRQLIGIGAALAAVFVFATGSATAATAGHISGGGTATISQVAFNVSVDGSGGASGSFDCLMAGRSSFVLGAFGLSHIMHVHATPTAGSISGSTVSFS